MYFYAYINASGIVEMVLSLPSQITNPQYISIDSNDQTLVGKWYNSETGEFETITAWYYAQLNEKNIVTTVFEVPSQLIQDNLIRINSLDESLVGKWYNVATGEFVPAPIHILAELSSDVINYKNQDRWLNDVIDSKANTSDVYSKTEADDKYALKGEGGSSEDGKSAYELAVEEGYVGTLAQWLASLRGDTGAQGPQGERGLQGVQGPQGLQGIEGPKGDNGLNGKSCYEIAVTHGFAGTEAQFVASMKGETGAQGPKGDTGAEGPRGYPGERGPMGYAGPQGPKGDKGDDFDGQLASNILRLNGTQALFKTSSIMTLSTNSLQTQIAGSAIYSSQPISVSSDERLKKNIIMADSNDATDLIKRLKVVNYKYKNNPDVEHIGVIAQDVEAMPGGARYVDTAPDGFKCVKIEELIFPVILAVQDLLKNK